MEREDDQNVEANQTNVDKQKNDQGQPKSKHSRSYIRKKLEHINQGRNVITGTILLVSQIVITVVNGIYIRPIIQNDKNFKIDSFTFFGPMVISIASTLGLGLLFSYHKRLIISGLGFSFFINAYALQYYPLISALWTQTKIFKEYTMDSEIEKPFFLGQYMLNTDNVIANYNHNHIEGCFRAAISINVAVSCVLGRVSLFQVLISILIGIFGYELNRRTCMQNFGDDAFGSIYIFAFGGFMGLAMGLILRFQDRRKQTTLKHKLYQANQFSLTLSLFGSAILMISLPFMALFYHKNFKNNLFLLYSPTLCIILSSSAGLIGSLAVSLISRGNLHAKDMLHGPIAGAIIGGASSYFTTNLAFCLSVGLVGGSLQSVIQNTFEKAFTYDKRPIATISFALFGVQGFLACIMAVIGKQLTQSNPTGLDYGILGYESVRLFYFGLISCSMGFGFGIIIGLIFYLTNSVPKRGYFNDFFIWHLSFNPDTNISLISSPKTQDEMFSDSQKSISTIKPDNVIDFPY